LREIGSSEASFEIFTIILHPGNHQLKVYFDVVDAPQNPPDATKVAAFQIQYDGRAPPAPDIPRDHRPQHGGIHIFCKNISACSGQNSS
jgi:hypothetical protein